MVPGGTGNLIGIVLGPAEVGYRAPCSRKARICSSLLRGAAAGLAFRSEPAGFFGAGADTARLDTGMPCPAQGRGLWATGASASTRKFPVMGKKFPVALLKIPCSGS